MDEPKLPTDKFSAWSEAEKLAIQTLCEATGHSLGTNAFIGEIADVANSFFVTCGSVQYGGEVFYAPNPSSFCIPYAATGIFLSREAAQRFAMKVVCALPVRGIGNIAEFRMANNGIGRLRIEAVQFRGESVERPAYIVDLNFDLVVRID